MQNEIARLRNHGMITIPADVRRHFDLHDGSLLIVEAHANGILLRPSTEEARAEAPTADSLFSNTADTPEHETSWVEMNQLSLNFDNAAQQNPA